MASNPASMNRKELIAALTRLNPFGGYSQSRLTDEQLRATLRRYQAR